MPSKNTASLCIYCVRRDLGHRRPRLTSDPRVKALFGELKTGVGVVLGGRLSQHDPTMETLPNALYLKRDFYASMYQDSQGKPFNEI
ncbi:hypothetical protein AALO_G00050050 [Alosa alosa]|uniref:Uncharacterized protein n=1 Tax=Alosa alosa TaxID=278164 RepID=A0AAV6H809_9TELE|nr:hypothetical protein AALO_G00050050 [Alosa alosa]